MDVRENLIKAFKVELYKSGYEPDDIVLIGNVLIKCLDDYDVDKKVRDVVVYEDESHQILRYFCATMMTEGRSKKTIEIYYKIINLFLDETKKPLKNINSYDIISWLAKKQTDVSQRTAENYRAYLSSFFKWLSDEEIIDKNPMIRVKPIKYQKKNLDAFSSCDIDAIRNATECVRDRAIIELLLSSGIRVSELIELRISDINLSKKEVFVRNGKGSKQRKTYFDELTEKYIKMYLDSRSDNSEYLFIQRRSSEPISSRGVEKLVSKLGAKANVEKCHPHRFRRTFATRLSIQVMNMRYIQLLMGHENLNVTMEYIATNDSEIYAEYRNKIQ